MKNIRFFILFLILPIFFIACKDDSSEFSSSPGLSLTFSKDTVRFDTIFSTFGSATTRLKIYNCNKNAICIDEVELMGAGQTGFRINVDGVPGDKIKNVEVYGKDSAFVFIEITVDPINSNTPLLIEDSIRFSYNGKSQYVRLEAIGQDAIVWNKKIIEQDTTITSTKPFLVLDTLLIKEGATLNIEGGTKLHFHSGAMMHVQGRINAKGTRQNPVQMRGDRYDYILTNTPYNNIPGQWGGITFDSLSFDNYFESVKIRGMEKGIEFRRSDPAKEKATFLNCEIHNSTGDLVSAVDCNITVKNSLLSNAGKAVARLIGGNYTFVHCTLANYMTWWGMIHEKALVLGNYIYDDDGNQIAIPLQKCDFINSIISGSSSSEVTLANTKNSDNPFAHYFSNCLIKASGKDDENFVNTVWYKNSKTDPKFVYLNADRDYYYDFHLDSESAAINKAESSFTVFYSLQNDLDGVSRLADNDPDIGCYEWVKKEEE
ncbi:hypothetical protein M2132_000295 [Dysgonomonas sp. PH5-45]|uniref:hypothetical protein n=1 Tax=unclassified Dysgonomonas TaxID=2630389 RepID=UPI00247338CB|nr:MULTISPECIES: hypothetical protein [unclassified Dysgonomonas]MDH6353975.1 hypothetical protein [Dysgonomonas sp. PH5-45]MDH6386877.1 hypothetical protein [Dysgonomonas sp. PH5-37]